MSPEPSPEQVARAKGWDLDAKTHTIFRVVEGITQTAESWEVAQHQTADAPLMKVAAQSDCNIVDARTAPEVSTPEP